MIILELGSTKAEEFSPHEEDNNHRNDKGYYGQGR